MSTLLSETIEVLEGHEKTPAHVLWVGSAIAGIWCTWDEFTTTANVEYDASYGSAEICTDLIVVGTDFWLSRAEYDGSEWWEYNECPQKPGVHFIPKVCVRQGTKEERFEDCIAPLNKIPIEDNLKFVAWVNSNGKQTTHP